MTRQRDGAAGAGSRGTGRQPTIYEALAAKLGREPTHGELCADVRRILAEVTAERAAAGKLAHQRRRP